jgi:hypothetical protein
MEARLGTTRVWEMPEALFANNEQGLWLDPSDTSTMFQNAAGTTPVTGVEQPVGRMLDKSGNGNHVSQSADARRPILRARYNLLQRTEEFNNAYWSKVNATVAANTVDTTDPLGTNTADKLAETSANNFHYATLASVVSVANNTSHIWSVYAKKAERSWLCLDAFSGSGANCWFDLDNGVTGTTAAGCTTSITSAGNGWYRCVVQRTTAAITASFSLVIASADNVGSYQGITGNGIYLWGADLRVANDGVGLPVYQRVGAATDYTTTGFPPYLAFDGTDDCLFTASTVDFTATDEMTVCAGVRKLGDSPQSVGTIVELSTTTASLNGSFAIVAPRFNSVANSSSVSSRGTTSRGVVYDSFTTPSTAILCMLSDISADSVLYRFNGTQVSQNTDDQGSGNFGNYVLYLGARADSSLRFRGNMFGLIARGATTATPTLEQTETWMNGKTKAF